MEIHMSTTRRNETHRTLKKLATPNHGGSIATPLETMQITQSEHAYDNLAHDEQDALKGTLNSQQLDNLYNLNQ